MAQTTGECTIMGNTERNSFVCSAITDTLLDMLKTRKLSEIAIGEITSKAQVSRNSFYRNFESKEDILRQRIRVILKEWKNTTDFDHTEDPIHLYCLLFHVVEQRRDFFLLLKDAGLLYLLQAEFFDAFGLDNEDDDISAFSKSFFSYSTFGFLDTWIRRGMKQSADEMEIMLKGAH